MGPTHSPTPDTKPKPPFVAPTINRLAKLPEITFIVENGSF